MIGLRTSEKKKANSRAGTLISLFFVFLKIGAFTFGGGYTMLPLVKNEVVEKKKWITAEAFVEGVAVAESIPGGLAVNTATYVGNKVCGNMGSVVAVMGAVLPSFLTRLAVAIFFLHFRELSIVQNFFKGAKPAIAALLVSAVIDLGKDALKKYREIIVTAGLLFLLLFFDMHPVLAIVIAAVLGLFF